MTYQESKAINNSLLSYFEIEQGGSPQKFYNQWTNPIQTEEKDYQKYGTALHCYLLEPDKFKEQYAISNFTEEQTNNKFLQFIDKNIEFEIACQYLCEEYVLKKDVKKEETKIKHYTEHLEYLQQFKNYFEFLINTKDKIIITQYDYDKICKTYFNIQQHKLANKLINEEGLCEQEIYKKIEGLDCKAKIDKYTNNFILDIKTTSKSVYQFKESYDKYFYARQAVFYTKMLERTCDKTSNNHIDFYFLVCSSFDCSICVYKVTNLIYDYCDLKNMFEDIKKHIELNNWSCTIEEINNKMCLCL